MSLPESSWDDLLQAIDERRVIPIVGPELLRFDEGGEQSHFDRRLAQRLAQRLGVPAADLPEEGAINHVVCLFLRKSPQNRRERVYSQLRLIMNEMHPRPPEALLKLAGIRHFQMYVSLTTDSLLKEALAEARGAEPDIIIYTPCSSDVHDLPCEIKDLKRPTVFHLMGRASSTPDYVVTEEDTLEFFHAMQAGKRPNLLFDELKNHHLLLIGCRHPDWLARLFIRLVKGTRLSGPRDWQEIVADRATARDRGLAAFLEHFSYGTQVFAEGDALQFVNELAERYQNRRPKEEEPAAAAEPRSAPPLEMVPGAIFLSYSSRDLVAVNKIYAALKDLGADVWLDRAELKGGDNWDREIQRNIRLCSFFLPVISSNTEALDEGYFRKEWRWAAERAHGMEDSTPFIVPLAIDEVSPPEARAPEVFRAKQFFRIPGGEATGAFKARMVELLRGYRKRERRLA